MNRGWPRRVGARASQLLNRRGDGYIQGCKWGHIAREVTGREGRLQPSRGLGSLRYCHTAILGKNRSTVEGNVW
jgi:hypothetical protein